MDILLILSAFLLLFSWFLYYGFIKPELELKKTKPVDSYSAKLKCIFLDGVNNIHAPTPCFLLCYFDRVVIAIENSKTKYNISFDKLICCSIEEYIIMGGIVYNKVISIVYIDDERNNKTIHLQLPPKAMRKTIQQGGFNSK